MRPSRAWLAAAALALAGCAVDVSDEPEGDVVVPLPRTSWQTLTVADGAALLVGAEDDELRDVIAWDLDANRERWHTRVRWPDGPWNVATGLYDADGALVFVLRRGLAALDTESGRVRWEIFDGEHVAGLGAANGAFYAVVEGERFVAVDLRDGREIGSIPSPDPRSTYFGCEHLTPDGSSATLVTSADEEPTRYHRIALRPSIGAPRRVKGPPEHTELSHRVHFEAGDTRARSGIHLAITGDERAPKLGGWSTDTWSLRWEMPLPERLVQITDDRIGGPILFDRGRWFLVATDETTNELRRAEDGTLACTWSFPEEIAPRSLDSLRDHVLLDHGDTLTLYDPRDCSVRWTGKKPFRDYIPDDWMRRRGTYTVDFDEQHLVILEWALWDDHTSSLEDRLRIVDLTGR